jgi:cbb3-type cytochrome oxidase maturation protein
MSAIYLLIGVSFLIALGFLMSFIFAIKSGQYDDTHTPSIRILFDDEQSESKN